MRTISGGERAILASAHPNFYLRVEVQDSTAAWRDLTNISGVDYLDSATWSASIDTAIMTGTVTLKREQAGVSLSPLLDASPLNTPGPFLDVGRGIRITTAVTANGVAPITGDWKQVFLGLVTDIAFDADPITLTIADLGQALTDMLVESLRPDYGVPVTGVPAEAVMQHILDDNAGAGVYTLYTPVSPSYSVTTYKPLDVGVLEALRTLALNIGWDVRYMYDAADVFRLTFFSVDRTKVVSDATIGPSEYLAVNRLALSNADVRNTVLVSYQANGSTFYVNASDAGSIAEFGRRYSEFNFGTDDPIHTDTDANKFAASFIHDMSEPLADQEIELFYWWPVQLSDLYTFTANGVHYDVDQQFAVIGYTHTLTAASHRTRLVVRGKVAGAYRQWLLIRGGAITGLLSTGPAPIIFPLLAELQAFQNPNEDGMAWQQVKFEKTAATIDIFGVESVVGGPGTSQPIPELAANRLCYALKRQEGDLWNADDQAFIVGISTRANYWRKTISLGIGYDGTRGPTVVREAQAVDIGTPPVGPPTAFTVTPGTGGTSNRCAWTTGDPLAYTLLFRNGYGIVLQPGVTALLDTGINTSIPYSYQICHWRDGQTSAFFGVDSGTIAPPPPITIPPTSSVPLAPVWQAGYPQSSGASGVDYRWTVDPATTNVAIEINVFTLLTIWTTLVSGFSGGTYVPSGAYLDTGTHSAGTILQARIRATVGGVDYYSDAVTVTYGVATVAPVFAGGTPYFSASDGHTHFQWTLASSAATSLDVIHRVISFGGVITDTVLYTESSAPLIQAGSFSYFGGLAGSYAFLRANYSGGSKVCSPVYISAFL